MYLTSYSSTTRLIFREQFGGSGKSVSGIHRGVQMKTTFDHTKLYLLKKISNLRLFSNNICSYVESLFRFDYVFILAWIQIPETWSRILFLPLGLILTGLHPRNKEWKYPRDPFFHFNNKMFHLMTSDSLLIYRFISHKLISRLSTKIEHWKFPPDSACSRDKKLKIVPLVHIDNRYT